MSLSRAGTVRRFPDEGSSDQYRPSTTSPEVRPQHRNSGAKKNIGPEDDSKSNHATRKGDPLPSAASSGSGLDDGSKLALGYDKPTGPVGTGPWPDTSSLPGWNPQAKDNGATYIADNDVSPKYFLNSNPNTIYQQTDRLIAHRGLVDLKAGVTENSLDSVLNAFDVGDNLVELDVQSTADGVAIPQHDVSLVRTTGINADANTLNMSAIDGLPLLIKNPLFDPGQAIGPGNYQYYKSTDTMMPLKDLLSLALSSNPGATFFLDPKNLASAKAVAQMVIDDPTLASHIVMKTYTIYWGADDAQQFWGVAKTPQAQAALSKMMIMPVDNETNGGAGIDLSPATGDVLKDVTNWGQHFQVPAVELPGYWDPNWQALSDSVSANLKTNPSDIPNNPAIPDGEADHNYTPVISTGYRYEDFSINGVPYDWTMDGNARIDTANAARRTPGAQGASKGWITTDVPLIEANAISDLGNTYPSGNPQVAFTGSTSVQNDAGGDDGDQGGP